MLMMGPNVLQQDLINVESFDLGLLNTNCHFCDSSHFILEEINQIQTTFVLCCDKGKIQLVPYQILQFTEQLIMGST